MCDDLKSAGGLRFQKRSKGLKLILMCIGNDALRPGSEAGGCGNLLTDQGIDQRALTDLLSADDADKIKAAILCESGIDQDGSVSAEEGRRRGAGQLGDFLNKPAKLCHFAHVMISPRSSAISA